MIKEDRLQGENSEHFRSGEFSPALQRASCPWSHHGISTELCFFAPAMSGQNGCSELCLEHKRAGDNLECFGCQMFCIVLWQ